MEKAREAIREGALAAIDEFVGDLRGASDELRHAGEMVALSFELAVLAGDTAAYADLERRSVALAELARIHGAQAEKAAAQSALIIAARALRATLLVLS